MSDQQAHDGNWLLGVFAERDRERFLHHADRVALTRDHTAFKSGETASVLYFPLDAVVSLVQTTRNGEINEIATVGKDGMVGLPAFLCGGFMPWDALCQLPGDALRVPAEVVGNVTTAKTGVRDVLGRYSQALLVQITRNSACNQFHTMLQRCSRWILMVRRQSGRDEFPLTQQALAAMLGVRRATVTVTAGELQKSGAIRYHHGQMRVIDAATLQKLACECYSVITESYDHLLQP